MKQLFTGVTKKKQEPAKRMEIRDKYMVREDEMRQRYKEYSGGRNGSRAQEPKVRFYNIPMYISKGCS